MQTVLAKGKWILLAVTVILVAGTAAILSRQSAARKQPAQAAVAHSPAQQEINLPGRIQAQHTILVPAPISGMIESFEVDLNQEVFEGQILAHIKSQALAASQEAAAADVESAQARVNNLEAAIVAARLEASRAAAEASRVNSEYSRAQKNYEHQKLLWSAGATPRLTYEKSESDFQSIEQQWTSVNELAKNVSDRVDSLQKEFDNTKKLLEHKLEEQESVKTQLAAGEVRAPV